MKTVTVNGRSYNWPSAPLVVISCDGSEPAYMEIAMEKGLMPNLKRIIAKGENRRGLSVIPSFTNPNNLSIVTGRPPEVHGICGNYLIDPATGQETMMNDPKWLRAPTIFEAFQKAVTLLSFTPEYYNAHHTKLLGPEGGWKELNGRYPAHSRLIDACVGFDSRSRLGQVRCPTLVLHAALDQVTSPRTTLPIEQGIPGAIGETWDDLAHVVAGKEQKIRFARRLFDWLSST